MNFSQAYLLKGQCPGGYILLATFFACEIVSMTNYSPDLIKTVSRTIESITT